MSTSSEEKTEKISSCTSCRVTGSVSLLVLAGLVHRAQATSPSHRVMLTVSSLALLSLAGLRAADWRL